MADKKLICNICGKEFTPWSNDRKIIKTSDDRYFDTFDCPKCGCQIVAQERLIDGKSRVNERDKFRTNENSLFDSRFVFKNRLDAVAFIDNISDFIRKYDYLSVADVKELIGRDETVTYADTKIRWYTLDGIRLHRKQNGYFCVHMPVPKNMNKGEVK